MPGNPILVTGATGQHGSTGDHLVRRLLEGNHRERGVHPY
jgi:nucleoside-diphosphate-sugar epimerase